MFAVTSADDADAIPAGNAGDSSLLPGVPAIPVDTLHARSALALPATPEAAGRFRRHTVQAGRRWRLSADSRETVEVCVSELVTNAIVHGVGRNVLLVLYYTQDSVLIEVFGRAVDRPVVRRESRADWAEGGRGLFIVETLAKDWGSENTEYGLLRVWASIAVQRMPEVSPGRPAR